MAYGPGPDLLGRGAELAEASRFLEGVVAGRSGVLVITGEPGIGKTSLARRVVAEGTDSGFRSSWTWCWAATEAPPFWPWRQAARELKWTGVDWTDIASAFSSMAELLTGTPTLIVLDDAHGADESSLALVNLVARSLSTESIAMILTVCEEDVPQTSRIAHLLDDISRGGTRLDLFGLDKEASSELLERVAGGDVPPLVRDAVASASAGNPFLVEQLAKETSAGRDLQRPDLSMGFTVPRGADAVLDRVLRRLSDGTRETLSVASVLGRIFTTDLLAEVGEVSGEPLTTALAEATEKGAVGRIDSLGTYGFTHALLRELLYEELADDRRYSLHQAAALALEGRADPSRASELADHYFKAGAQQPDVPRAIATIVRAAEAAAEAGSPEGSDRHLYRARRLARAAGLPEPTGVSGKEASEERSPAHVGMADIEAVFAKQGEYWSVGLGGDPALVKDSRGMGYLASLLSTPQKEWHSLELAAPARKGHRPTSTDMGPALDPKAKSEYRQRLLDLEEEIAEATEFNDEGRLRKAETEKQFLLDELSTATGLGGRDRVTGSDSERARVAVTRAIRSALRRIAASHPALGDHLDRTIQTGTFLSYRPDPMATPSWRF